MLHFDHSLSAGKKRTASFLFLLLIQFSFLTLSAHASERALVSKVNPAVPEVAKRMHLSGTVKMIVTINASGSVTDVKTVDGNRMLAGAAEQAIRRWKYAAGAGEESFEVNVRFAGE